MSYTPETPSSDLGEDAQAYLAREFGAIQEELQRRTLAGSAGLYLTAPAAASFNITPTPAKITSFDAKLIREQSAFGNLPNDTLLFSETGLWAVGLQIVFEVTPSSANTTREMYVQFYDEISAQALDVIASASIARYGEYATISGMILKDVETTGINRDYALYIYSPSGDTIAVTGVEIMDYYAFRVSKED